LLGWLHGEVVGPIPAARGQSKVSKQADAAKETRMSETLTGPAADGNQRHTPKDTRKKDQAPRGVFRHPSGVWAARFTCGAGHIHKERVGPLKSDAIRSYYERRARAHDEPGWCPALARRHAREQAAAAAAQERARMTFGMFAEEHYLPYAKVHKRSWRTDRSRITWLVGRFGAKRLDEVTSQDVEGVLVELRGDRQPGTVNRYRDLLSAIFKRALRDGHVPTNPVRAVSKLKEPAGRVAYLLADEELAVNDALVPTFRPHFLVSINTGLRYREQLDLRWANIDALTGLITVRRTKNGHARQIPMNSLVRSTLMDLAAKRKHQNDPTEYVFDPRPVQSKSFFNAAMERAQAALREAGKDVSRLEGYVWHGNRHTFASRLVMAGVDLRTVQELGGWRSLAMVQKYAHLAPGHQLAAVEALVRVPELARNLPEPAQADLPVPAK
jgi:site-specific recombinase XerD